MKGFNTAGPTIPEDHYHIDPLGRLRWDEIISLIVQKRYFLLHAPRRSGKTTTLLAMMKRLNASGDFACAYVSVEGVQTARDDEEKGIDGICGAIVEAVDVCLHDETLKRWYYPMKNHLPTGSKLTTVLKEWARTTTRPTVLLLDEIESLVGDTLVALLRQIRAGYVHRPEAFVQSMVLCGIRDIRDYRIPTPGTEIIAGGSAFNIKAESIRLPNFDYDASVALWKQHTEATGQSIETAVFALLWEDTKGQPWLLNALGDELIRKDPQHDGVITPERYKAARERLIRSRATHLGVLADTFEEPRVHRVISTLLEGGGDDDTLADEDLLYTYDLGLIDLHPRVAVANRIYKEVIPRDLTWSKPVMLTPEASLYKTVDNHLKMPELLAAYQQYFREHGDMWIGKFNYKEAAPQLLMQAFLRRVIDGHGRISSEYGLGRRRTDLCIE